MDFNIGQNKSTKKEDKSPIRQLYEWLEVIIISICTVVLVLALVGRYSPVSGESMNETLQDKDIVIISDMFYTPKQGDIVVFMSQVTTYEKPYIKRVIATEGQTIDYDPDTGVVTVDGEALKESDYATYKGIPRSAASYDSMDYSKNPEGEPFSYPYTVPQGFVFCMGDNRWNSHDSRDIGPVDQRCIVGHVVLRLFPVDSFGTVK